MSVQHGRGGMGSHKHGVSGRNHTHPAVAADVCRESNKQRIKRYVQEARESVAELFREYRKER